MLSADGGVYAFGSALQPASKAPAGAVDIESTPSGQGYGVVTERGVVASYGDARFSGSWGSLAPGERVTSMSVVDDGSSFWLFTNLGRVKAFGAKAAHYGDMDGTRLNAEVLDSVATPSGNGYWMVAADGGIFSFGDAAYYGSTGEMQLNKPVMSMAPDPDGAGYWLVASDGGIFSFSAEFRGSMGATPLNKPISGMVAGPGGYLMVGEDGGIFAFGDAPYYGSLGANPPPSPVVAVAMIPAPDGIGLLAALRRAPENARTGYDRDLFPHWLDLDGNGCDTREDVLLVESTAPTSTGAGCAVTGGQWFSAYDGVTTTDPSTVHVDHVVALAEAWDSGAATWDSGRRRDFANDLDLPGALIAVSASSNTSKSDQDPAEWLPSRAESHCQFATDWVTVKLKWDLSADDAEISVLQQILSGCHGVPVTPPPAAGNPSAGPPPSLTVQSLSCEMEQVTVQNTGSSNADLTGWKIHDDGALHTYSFPAGYTLPAGAAVTVRSGGAAGAGELHWMNGFVWNNTGDTAHLLNPSGATTSTRTCAG